MEDAGLDGDIRDPEKWNLFIVKGNEFLAICAIYPFLKNPDPRH
jgi:hypothetical protein